MSETKLLGDVVIPAGKYTKDGQEKTRWHKVGAAFIREGKISIKLESLPLPNEKGQVWLSIFEPREGEGNQPQQSKQRPYNKDADLDDDIPF